MYVTVILQYKIKFKRTVQYLILGIVTMSSPELLPLRLKLVKIIIVES